MKICKPMVGLVLVGAVAFVLAGGADVYAAKPDCPHAGIECPMVWDPVICNDGVVYSNKCVARQHCAKGCVPYDDGVVLDKGGNCDRPKFCPMLWAPVICDDGKVYPNECYAQKKCATGCVPYGDWLLGDDVEKGGGCEKPKRCPLLWAPVICDDGKVYPNECWAQKKCATGCVPYDEGLAVGDEEKKKPGGDDGCPRVGWLCPDVWDPVICDDGQVYSNSCYAWVACATGCEPYGEGGVVLLKKAGCPWEDLNCPDVWNPVWCNGVIYSNNCYALRVCAPGCTGY